MLQIMSALKALIDPVTDEVIGLADWILSCAF
jgi:hypothetical protein